MNEKAFPNQLEMIDHVTYREVIKGGMDLRDYFAAKALTGLLFNSKCDYTNGECVEASYAIADEMLKQRKETK